MTKCFDITFPGGATARLSVEEIREVFMVDIRHTSQIHLNIPQGNTFSKVGEVIHSEPIDKEAQLNPVYSKLIQQRDNARRERDNATNLFANIEATALARYEKLRDIADMCTSWQDSMIVSVPNVKFRTFVANIKKLADNA